MIKTIGRYPNGRVVYRVGDNTPVFGYIAFGIIDRGTNVLQVRPTTICPQACIFCSVDAGLKSTNRWAEYIVEPDLIIKGVEKAIEEKSCDVEILLDTIGDALTYPWLIELVKELRKINGVKSIALETHGLMLTQKLVDKLNEAGLDRVNLSIETLNNELARYLYGVPHYDVRRVMDVAEYLVKETSIDLHVTPLWLSSVNDEDIVEVLRWALRIGAGKRWPPVTVQKYIRHKYGRKSNIQEVSWSEFWDFVGKLEEKVGTRLRWTMDEWGMAYTKRIKPVLKVGEYIEATIIGRGWLRGEYLAVYNDRYLVSVKPRRSVKVKLGNKYTVRIVSNKDNLYIANL
ncbi:MAG: radical SAM protein [Desulfurococcaceae archaeon]